MKKILSAAALALALFAAPVSAVYACGGHDEGAADEQPTNGDAKAAAPEQAKPEEKKPADAAAPAEGDKKPAEEAPASPDKT